MTSGTFRIVFFALCVGGLAAGCGDGCGGGDGGPSWTPEPRGDYAPYAHPTIPRAGGGVTYYVSSSAGDDANDGLSEAAPLASLDAVNQLAVGPGDTVALRCGDVWRAEILHVTRSGAADNYLTYTSYPEGCADRPALLGSVPIMDWSLHAGEVWVADLSAGANADRFALGVNQLFRRGERLRLGRWPNLDAPDGGYSTIEQQIGPTILADDELPAGDWTGAVAHIKGMRWYILNREVVGGAGGQLELGAEPGCWGDGCAGWGYFLNSHLDTLDQDGEWFYDEATQRVYVYSSEGAPTDMEGSVILEHDSEYVGGVIIGNHLQQEVAYVAIENLEVSRWFQHGITYPVNLESDENHHLMLRYNVIRDVDSRGLNLATWVWNAGGDSGWRGGRDLEIAHNLIEGANHFGITGYFSQANLVGNTLRNIGVLDSVGRSGIGCGLEDGGGFCTEPGDGLRVTVDQAGWNGNDILIRDNWIENIGYCGIDFFGADTTIEYNVILRACVTKGDCGGLRTFGRDSLASTSLRRLLVADNLVLDTLGVTDGCHEDFRALFGFGLYIDHYSRDVHCWGNTVLNSTASGILYQNSSGTIADNLVVGNATGFTWGTQVDIHGDASRVRGLSGNVMVSLGESGTLAVDPSRLLTAASGNSYLHPSAADHIRADGSHSLASWQDASGYDGDSTELVDPAVADAVVLYNDSDASADVDVPAGSWVLLDGSAPGTTINLPPFGSVLLLPDTLL